MADRDTVTLPARPGLIAHDRKADPETPKTLGRYRIEGRLGEGGMGVVYAAFDPDLERHVAIKLLHESSQGARLLREARVMAKLSHPNVVAVYEVGSFGSHVFVAMELVDGCTLDAWLDERARNEREIIDMFTAAGRGLAAAHAESVVHRDFKPHNVLVDRDGRVAVTDFGLARSTGASSHGEPPQPPRVIDPLGGASRRASEPQLTATGNVLGTPAYMAPEQWSGEPLGPAADQFAFCVALWEALTGKRPYRGDSDDEIRASIAGGPTKLDPSALPRRLRGVLLRGLQPDPARRWPSMDALLVRLRGPRRWPLAVAAATLALGALAAAMFARDRDLAGAACDPPRRDPDSVLASRDPRGDVATVLDGELAAWRFARAGACASPTGRDAKTACLDGALDRLAAAAAAAGLVRGALAPDTVADWLVDPATCLRPNPPSLRLPASDGVARALAIAATALGPRDAAVAARAVAMAEAATADPCAQVIALMAAMAAGDDDDRIDAWSDLAHTADQRCNDAHLSARLKLLVAHRLAEWPGFPGFAEAARTQAETAVEAVPEPALVRALDVIDAAALMHRGKLDDALARTETAIRELAALGRGRTELDARALRLIIYAVRGRPEDLAALRAEIVALRPRVDALGDPAITNALAQADALARWRLGEIAEAHAAFDRLWRATPPRKPFGGPQHIDGQVVDRDGHPVAGATVYASGSLIADGRGVVAVDPGDLRAVTTDADGRFAIPDASPAAAVIAIAGDRRSSPAEADAELRLVVGPTRTIAGTVELDDVPWTNARVEVASDRVRFFRMIAPVAKDGAYRLDGVPPDDITVMVMVGVAMDRSTSIARHHFAASRASVTDLRLAVAKTGRTVHVIVRSTLTAPLPTADVLVVRGNQSGVTKLRQARGRELPLASSVVTSPIDELRHRLRDLQPQDQVAVFDDLPSEPLSACALAMPATFSRAETADKYRAHMDDLEVRCVPIAADAQVVVVETPPQRRFD